MMRIFKNIRMTTNNFRLCSTNNCDDSSLNSLKRTKLKSEQEIMEMIHGKIKEYQELLNTQSPETEKICTEINKLETRLRKSYGFSENENLTIFPEFEFDDPEIDDQLGSIQRTK